MGCGSIGVLIGFGLLCDFEVCGLTYVSGSLHFLVVSKASLELFCVNIV